MRAARNYPVAAGAVGRLVSAPRCVGCKRVIRIAGIHKIRTRGAQQFFDLLDRSSNDAARLAALTWRFSSRSPRLALSRRCASTVAT